MEGEPGGVHGHRPPHIPPQRQYLAVASGRGCGGHGLGGLSSGGGCVVCG